MKIRSAKIKHPMQVRPLQCPFVPVASRKPLPLAGLLLSLCLGLGIAAAQPSGGPYGPIRKSYKLPAVKGRILFAAPDGVAQHAGETKDEPTTIEAAVERAGAGDAIVLRGGVYRTGNLVINQGITIQPYEGEKPVLKGTRVAEKWVNLGNGLWTTSWATLFPSKPQDWWRRPREGKKTPLHRFNNDMVFIDGKFLQSAGWEGEVDENSYCIDYDIGTVYIGTEPAGHTVEITAHDAAIIRTTGEAHGRKPDRKGPVIRGISFTQYAYRALEFEGKDPEGPSPEAEHGKQVIGSLLEDCTISYCSRVAAYLRADSLTIRRCRVSDTSTEGIYIIASNDVLLEKNIFTRNNIENITGYYPAAVKIFNQCHRVTCRDNLVCDLPHSNGIWYDVGNVDGVFVNNWVEGVGRLDFMPRTDQLWPSDNGFFFEISKGAVCAGNVFVNCDHGLMILNSSDVLVCQNTFVNSMACIGRDGRVAAGDHFGWHPSTGPDVDRRDGHVFMNNLLTGGPDFARSLLFVWQPAGMCGRLPKPMLKQMANNVFVRGAARTSAPMILWSPASNGTCQAQLASLQEMRERTPEFAEGSREFTDYDGPLFRSGELGNFRLMPEFPGYRPETEIPVEISRILGLSKNLRYTGAYPPAP
jgi:hypothetical protein